MFFQRLSLLCKRFSPLERAVLEAIREVLSPDAGSIFNEQVCGITRVQRAPPNWNEILFYRIRRGKADWSSVPSFPRANEFRLAKVTFSVNGKPYTATLRCIDGHIFSLIVIPGAKPISFASWDGPPSVVLQADPLEPISDREAEVLPASWQRFLQQQDAQVGSLVTADGWILHDEMTAYRVAFSDHEFLVLAEREGHEWVLHSLEPPADELFHLDTDEGDEPKVLVGSLDALLQSND